MKKSGDFSVLKTITANTELSHYILENLSSAVLLFDAACHLIYLNAAGEMLLEGSARQLLGRHVEDVLSCQERIIANDLRRCMESGVSLAERDLVLTIVDHAITVNCIATPLFEKSKPALILIEMQQVDRHIRISREEYLLAQQYSARMMVRGLAHEIKNPLGGIRGAAQLLAGELNDDELREYTRIIINESDRLQALMDRMLGPNKLPHKKLVNLHRVLEHVRQLAQVEALPGIILNRDYDPSIPPLIADEDQLIQAVLNIVRNAIQALDAGGTVLLRSRIHGQMRIGDHYHKLVAKIDVIDDGPGIKPDILSQIFYPMVTGRAEGTGLGLSIAQSLINRHGGIVECSSVPGETVFSIFLPLENGNHE